jgi:hypothetical protein
MMEAVDQTESETMCNMFNTSVSRIMLRTVTWMYVFKKEATEWLVRGHDCDPCLEMFDPADEVVEVLEIPSFVFFLI